MYKRSNISLENKNILHVWSSLSSPFFGLLFTPLCLFIRPYTTWTRHLQRAYITHLFNSLSCCLFFFVSPPPSLVLLFSRPVTCHHFVRPYQNIKRFGFCAGNSFTSHFILDSFPFFLLFSSVCFMFFVWKAQTINSCRRGSTTCRLYSLYTHKPPLLYKWISHFFFPFFFF